MKLTNETATYIFARKPDPLKRGEINTMASNLVTQYPAFSLFDRFGGHTDTAKRIQSSLHYLRILENGQARKKKLPQNDQVRLYGESSDEDDMGLLIRD